jgi:hypothetical protein
MFLVESFLSLEVEFGKDFWWTVSCLGQGAFDLMQEETEDDRDLFTGLNSTRSGLRISSFNWPLLPVPEAVLL